MATDLSLLLNDFIALFPPQYPLFVLEILVNFNNRLFEQLVFSLLMLLLCVKFTNKEQAHRTLCPHSCWLQKSTHNVRAVSWVLFSVLLRIITRETASQIAPRNCSKEVGERPVYVWFRLKNTCSQPYISVEVTASHEEQVSQLMILVLFYVWEDARILVHKTFFLKYI